MLHNECQAGYICNINMSERQPTAKIERTSVC